MNDLIEAAYCVRDDEPIDIHCILNSLCECVRKLRQLPRLTRVSGDTTVIGPVRGHACDFAHYVLTKIIPNRCISNIVLLGNYIDGAHHSLEVLYLVCRLVLCSEWTVVPLIGRHELLYPILPDKFGSLANELDMRALRSSEKTDLYDKVISDLFSSLPVACLVNGQFFCVAGGPASGYRYLAQIEAETSQEKLSEFVLNEQMDEDEERIAGGSAFVASQNSAAFRFTYNAACNFVSRNNMSGMIVGMEYHYHRPDYHSFARLNHYKESVYFPGYTLSRINPETQIAAVLALFSAPCFCGVNYNNASIAVISDEQLEIHKLTAYAKRPLITPGSHKHAFSWAQPMLEGAVSDIMREVILGALRESSTSDEVRVYQKAQATAVAKMYRMCTLLKARGLPLPDFSPPDTSKDHNVSGENTDSSKE